jgi:hypothetical protein
MRGAFECPCLVANAYLWLEEAEEPELREYLPDVPLLTHVEIHEDYRSPV